MSPFLVRKRSALVKSFLWRLSMDCFFANLESAATLGANRQSPGSL